MICSLPGSSVHGILQARILEWVAIFLLQGIFTSQGLNLGLLYFLHWQADFLLAEPSGKPYPYIQFSCVRLFATPWTAACQAPLSITNSQSLLKLMSIESVMPSSHLILVVPFSSRPQAFPASESFQMSQLFVSGGQTLYSSTNTSPGGNTPDRKPLVKLLLRPN